MRRCLHCGRPIGDSRRANFCRDPCRKRAERRWAAGLPADAHNGPHGARRGRLPIGQPTTLERLLEEAREQGRAEVPASQSHVR